ncbi:nucleotidyl transferase AbiEii/AbiGii toxin family protein [Variovorax sp. LjRoot130]|uniref:nucleotidyl transferase AbiEii/AbiGii toxin family protein n=1 Tax=Variovorax sp. LjRoot130 TaxID=3342261 RepID=UPI003ECE6900
MNTAYDDVIASSDADRGALFVETAARLGTAVQNVEKDFWVCWTLDALFNGLEAGSPRLLFKGGTSLSKAFNLISRFSEDIDITVFREDIGQAIDAAELDGLSGKQQRKRLDAIREACQAFISGSLTSQLAQRVDVVGKGRMKLERDPDDADGQTLLLWYPARACACGLLRLANHTSGRQSSGAGRGGFGNRPVRAVPRCRRLSRPRNSACPCHAP